MIYTWKGRKHLTAFLVLPFHKDCYSLNKADNYIPDASKGYAIACLVYFDPVNWSVSSPRRLLGFSALDMLCGEL